MKSLIIPSAKLIPYELQKIGKLTPIVYPINQKIVFDFLYDQYKNDCDTIEILCFEAAKETKRRLSSYSDKRIKIHKLPELNDLGNTIYFSLENIHNPVIINFADTIIFDKFNLSDNDAYFYSEDYVSETWTFFEENNGEILKVYDKVKDNYTTDEKGKLFVGVFQISDSDKFRECLEEAFTVQNRQMSSFYYALMLYSKSHPMKAIKTDNWFDIGHADKYYNTQLEVKAREFNHITIDRDRGILRKSSDNKEKFIGEILWYVKLPRDLAYVCPRIFDYSTSYSDPFIEMKYYAYHTIHELFLNGDLTKSQWLEIFNRIRFVYSDFHKYSVSEVQIRDSLENMYLLKTQERLNELKQDTHFAKFFENPITVNSVKYKSLSDIQEILQVKVPELLYDIDKFYIIHGDLCFANIMIDNNLSSIKLIDPRGAFGCFDVYGDYRYELAKLLHSVDGKYDFIIKDLFTLSYDVEETRIDFSILDRDRDFDIYKIFIRVFEKEIGTNLSKIELIESLLFLSMIPLHKENANHQMAMLGTGLEILGRVLDIKEN